MLNQEVFLKEVNRKWQTTIGVGWMGDHSRETGTSPLKCRLLSTTASRHGEDILWTAPHDELREISEKYEKRGMKIRRNGLINYLNNRMYLCAGFLCGLRRTAK